MCSKASRPAGDWLFHPSAGGSVRVFPDGRPVIIQLQPLGGRTKGGWEGESAGNDRGKLELWSLPGSSSCLSFTQHVCEQ